ncbi:hypothetical protein SUGI_0926620, partial [Cryptomeria japonica]
MFPKVSGRDDSRSQNCSVSALLTDVIWIALHCIPVQRKTLIKKTFKGCGELFGKNKIFSLKPGEIILYDARGEQGMEFDGCIIVRK